MQAARQRHLFGYVLELKAVFERPRPAPMLVCPNLVLRDRLGCWKCRPRDVHFVYGAIVAAVETLGSHARCRRPNLNTSRELSKVEHVGRQTESETSGRQNSTWAALNR